MTTSDAGVYIIDPAESTIAFRTRAMFGLLGVKGTFPVEGGTVTVAEPPERSTVEVRISAAGFSTGNGPRDEHVRSADYLDAERCPHLLFHGERFEPRDPEGLLHGTLTVRGTTRPLVLDVSRIDLGGGELTARATATVDRFEFGIRTARGMTGRNQHLTVDVVARRS